MMKWLRCGGYGVFLFTTSTVDNYYDSMNIMQPYNENRIIIYGKAVRDRKLHRARATLPARNGSCDVIDHVIIRFPICHFL